MKRSQRLKCFIFLLIFFFLIFSHNLINAQERGLFWEVSSDKSTLHILGSVHLFKKDLYPLNETIERAFNEAEVVVFEINLKEMDSADFSTLFEGKGLYPEGDSLKAHVSEKTLDILMPKLKSYGIPPQLVMRFRPWLLAITLQTMELQKLGFLPEYGIDRYFFKKASGKEIKGLETVNYQIGLFEGLSERVEELFLLYTIRDTEQLSSIAQLIVKAWKEGDTSIIEDISYRALKEEPELLPVYEKLFFERNINMASKIEEYLKTGKRHFVIVGAGHLVGQKGIIELLKRKGYRIRQI